MYGYALYEIKMTNYENIKNQLNIYCNFIVNEKYIDFRKVRHLSLCSEA